MKNRYYFRNDDSSCWKIDAHIDYMREHGLKEMDVYLAERETNAPYFFCRHFQEVGEKEQCICGRSCKAYQPRNGVSGVCKHYGYTYSQTDKVIRLTPDAERRQNKQLQPTHITHNECEDLMTAIKTKVK